MGILNTIYFGAMSKQPKYWLFTS